MSNLLQSSQVQKTVAPGFYTDYLSGLASKGASAQTGAQFVGAQPLQEQAFQSIGQTAGQYQPMVGQGAGFVGQAGTQNITGAAAPYLGAATGTSPVSTMTPYAQRAMGATGVDVGAPLVGQGTGLSGLSAASPVLVDLSLT
jgi:hypothetical protein